VEALALTRRIGDRQAVAHAARNLASVAHEHGDVPAARALYEESVALMRAVGNRMGAAFVLQSLGSVAQEHGDIAAARAHFEESLALWQERGFATPWQAMTLVSLGTLAAAEGDGAGAAAWLRQALTMLRDLDDVPGTALALERSAGLAAAQGRAERALRLAGAAAGLRRAGGLPLPPEARQRLERTLAPAREALGAAAAGAAWTAGSTLSLAEAVAYALEPAQGAPATAARPAAARGPGNGLPGLTVREREVAALVAQGLTNQQIGAALVITEATAASHVHHVLEKLGFRSRTQIVAWAVAQGLAPAGAAQDGLASTPGIHSPIH
jgi:DNA-binding CsgD family transcriptional regulator